MMKSFLSDPERWPFSLLMSSLLERFELCAPNEGLSLEALRDAARDAFTKQGIRCLLLALANSPWFEMVRMPCGDALRLKPAARGKSRRLFTELMARSMIRISLIKQTPHQ